MIRTTVRAGVKALALLGVAGVVAACDNDPSAPDLQFPTAEVIGDSILTSQESIRIVFRGDSLSSASAQDPSNFVVINQCTGLRIAGALRLARGAAGAVSTDTLVFTPTETLPFLTLIGVRVQNLLTPSGQSLGAPLTFQFQTEPPAVTDLGWTFANSPTNDNVTGINFVTRQLGYVITNGGALFRTIDGGRNITPLYKDINTSNTFEVRAFGDTIFFVGARKFGTTTRRALFRSTDRGVTFDTVRTAIPFSYVNSMQRAPDGSIRGVFGGLFDKSYLYSYDSRTNSVTLATGLPPAGIVLAGADLSRNVTKAIAAFQGAQNGPNSQVGYARLSNDGGLTYQDVALPANTFALEGAGFINNNDALLLGDSSVVIRVNVATGTTTMLTAANGIPQTIRNAPGDFTTFSFSKARFAADGQTGYITGIFIRRRPGLPDLENGVILTTRDGGQTFTRLGIAGAPDDGLGFAPVRDLQVLATDFAALGGNEGLVATRTIAGAVSAGVCSFTTRP